MRYHVMAVLTAFWANLAHGQLQLVAQGPAFAVHAGASAPAVDCSSAGSCTVIWTSGGIFAQRYDPAGAAIAGPLQIASSPSGATIAASDDESFLVAWNPQDEVGAWSIVTRAYDGGEVLPDAPPLTEDPSPDVFVGAQDIACNADGDCAAIWDESPATVLVRRLDAGGQPRGAQILVATSEPNQGDLTLPQVAVAPSGRFLVAWTVLAQRQEDLSLDLSISRVMARLYGRNGDALSEPIEIARTRNEYGISGGLGVSVDSNGSFVVVWDSQLHADSSLNFQPRPGEIFAQRLDASGDLVGDPILVAAIDPTLRQFHSKVSASPDGSFLVVWEDSLISGTRERILGRLYDRDGNPADGVEQLNDPSPGYHRDPVVAADGDGNRLIAWQTANGVLARRFSLTGVPQGGDGDDDGCAIVAPHASPIKWVLLGIPMAIVLLLRRSARQRR